MWISVGPAASGFGTVSVAVWLGFVERHRGGLRRGAGADGHLPERRCRAACSTTSRRRLGDADADRFGAVEPLARQVDDERQVVVVGRDDGRKPLGGRG